jgi:long-chain fatty acid transport protein
MLNASSWVDAGYAHLFVKDATINDNQTATGKGILVGTYSGSIDIFSVQYTISF